MVVDSVDFGLLENAVGTITWLVSELKAHNGRLPPKKKPEGVEFTAELYEVHLDNISKLDGHGVLSNTAGSATAITDEIVNLADLDIPQAIANNSGDGSKGTSLTITTATGGGGSTLTEDTDYSINKVNGVWYVTAIDGGAMSTATDYFLNYTYTPNTTKTIVWSDILKLVTFYEVKFINTDENGKEFRIIMPKGYMGGNFDFGFVGDDAVDEVMKVPVSITAFPDDNNVMVRIEDEQSVV
jgi:hypothetical protein